MRFESRSKSGVKSYISIPTPINSIVSIPTVLQESISKLHMNTEVLEVFNWLRLSHCWNFICHWVIGENMNLTCTAINEQLILSLIFSLITVRSSLYHAVTGFWCHPTSSSIVCKQKAHIANENSKSNKARLDYVKDNASREARRAMLEALIKGRGHLWIRATALLLSLLYAASTARFPISTEWRLRGYHFI